MNITPSHKFGYVLALCGFLLLFGFVVNRSISDLALFSPRTQLAAVDSSDPAMTGWWKLADGVGATSAADSSGRGQNGTFGGFPSDGSQWVAGLNGTALSFNGSDSITLPAGAAQIGSGDFTVSAWANYGGPATGNVYEGLVASRNTGASGTQAGYVLGYINANTPDFVIDDGKGASAAAYVANAPTLSAGWHHLVGVFVNGSSMNLYVDGALVKTVTTNVPSGNITSPSPTRIGEFSGGARSPFIGKAQDVRTYSRALSAGEVSQLYSAGPSSQVLGSTQGTTQSTQTTQTTQTTTTQTSTNGVCGTAAKTYGATDVFPYGAYCATGTASPASPTNPSQGGSSSWTCAGTNGGTAATCSASRQVAATQQTVQSGSLATPTGLTATAISQNQISLSWNPVAGATSYTVYRNTSSMGTTPYTTFQSGGLVAGSTYGYTVAANDSSGNPASAQSAAVTGTTLGTGVAPIGYVLSFYPYQHAGQGTVTATVNGNQVLNCGANGSICSALLHQNDSIVLTATPAPGSSLARWEDCPNASGNTCTISMPNWNMSLGAFFTSGGFTPKSTLADIINLANAKGNLTWVFTGDSFTTLNTYSAYIESYFELHYPNVNFHFRDAARSGSALGDLMDDPTINAHVDPTTGAAVGVGLDSRFDMEVYGWNPDVVSVAFSDNGHPTPQKLAADYTTFINNYVLPNHSNPVLLGFWPINNASGLQEGTYMETLSDAVDQVGQQLGLPTGMIWHQMQTFMLPNLQSANPVNLNGLTNDTDTEHLNEAATLAAASYALSKLGADGNVSSVTIDAGAGTVTSATSATVTKPGTGTPGVVKNNFSGVDFVRKDDRLPMAFDDISRPIFQIPLAKQAVLDMNKYMLTVTNLTPGTYGIYIDGEVNPSATVDSNTLASGWNMTTMTQGPIHDQLVDVLGKIRDKEGVTRTRLFGPVQLSNTVGNPCASAGTSWWGVTAYNSNSGVFFLPGYRGDYLANYFLTAAKNQTACFDTLIHAAAQPLPRTFSIRLLNNTVSSGDTTAPTVSLSVPASNATVSGTAVSITALAGDDSGIVSGVQFKLDGASIGAEDTVTPYSINWNSTTVTNGTHTLVAVARDPSGNRATSTAVTITVNNTTTTAAVLSISAISSSTGATSALIQWTTNNPATSQVEYGRTNAYGSFTALDPTSLTNHSVTITGLTSNTTYHFRVASKDSAGNLASSTPDMTFTTGTPPAPGTLGLQSRVQATQDGTIAYSGVKITNVPPTLASTGVFNAGARGFIMQGPIVLNGITYWNVNFDNSKIPNYDGWVDASYLAPYTSTSAVPPVGSARTVNMYAGIAQAFSVDATDAAGDLIRINYPANNATARGGRLILTSNFPVTQASTSKEFNFIYVPPTGISAPFTDSFQYTLTDGVNTSVPYTVTFNVQAVTSSTWIPPIGIPRPEFGIDDTYRMYDVASNRNPSLTYYQSASGGYYTHYIDNTASNCVLFDSRKPTVTGTASAPLCNIPNVLPPGSVVEIHGGPYTTGQSSSINAYGGTVTQPIFIRGVGMPRFAATDPSRNWFLSNNQGGSGQYVVVEGLSLFSFLVGRGYSHVAFRNSDVYGDENGGGTGIQDSDTNYPILSNIVFYHNKVHDVGIWDTNRIAALCAAGVKPPTSDNNYCDRDIADTVFAWASLAENIWILDSDLSHSEGDSVQVNAGGQGLSLNPNLHHVYIGRNEMYENKQTATAIKAATHVVFSQNDMWGIATSTSSLGTATGFSDEGPTDTWWIFNRIHDSELGTKMNAGRGPGPYYYIGNLIYDIHDKYGGNGPFTGNYSQVGQMVADWHEAPTYFINNTFYEGDFGFGVWTANWTGSQPFVISNNIISRADAVGQMVYNQGDKYLQVTKNLFQGRVSDTTVPLYWIGKNSTSIAAFETNANAAGAGRASGNTAGNPMFVDPTHGDFNLQAGSPAIDAGDCTLMEQAASLFYTTFGSDIRKDFNGNNRPVCGSGNKYDLGAIEYGATGGNQPPPAVIVTSNPVTPPTNPAPTDTDGDGVADTSDLCANTPAGRTVNSVGCPVPVTSANSINLTVAPSLSSANLNSVSGLGISNSFGQVTWSSPVALVRNGDRLDLTKAISIARGTVAVDSVNYPELNKPATITFYGIVLSNASAVKILQDGALCSGCGSVTYSNNTLSFTVPHFSTYSIFDDSSSGDTTAPTVSITAPTNGSTVSGSVTLSVSASDDTGVAGVQYKLDNSDLNVESLTTPFNTSFDTTQTANGNHTILAIARDAAGNMATSSPITLTVNNVVPSTGGTTGGTTSTGGGGGGGGTYIPPSGGGGGGGSLAVSGASSGGNTSASSAPTIQPVSVPVSVYVTSRLALGSNSAEVKALQQILNAHGFVVAASGNGSPGNETTYFGPATEAALKRFQCAQGIVCSGTADTTGYGATGPKTRAAISVINVGSGSTAAVSAPQATPAASVPSGSITKVLYVGLIDSQVKTLQQILNAKGYTVSVSGNGSAGNETTYFGAATQNALQKFQCAKLGVCSGTPLSTGYGSTGPRTRAALSQ